MAGGDFIGFLDRVGRDGLEGLVRSQGQPPGRAGVCMISSSTAMSREGFKFWIRSCAPS